MKTVKVRIAIAINEHGKWSAAGGHNWSDDDAQSCVVEALDEGGQQLHWVTAEIPVPEITTIEGKLEPPNAKP